MGWDDVKNKVTLLKLNEPEQKDMAAEFQDGWENGACKYLHEQKN